MGEKPKTFEEGIDEVLAELRKILIAKNKDYGPHNIGKAGVRGVLIRAGDKMSRLENLYGLIDGSWKIKTQNFESITDTWLDLVNYGIIALMLLRNTWGLPHEEEEKKK